MKAADSDWLILGERNSANHSQGFARKIVTLALEILDVETVRKTRNNRLTANVLYLVYLFVFMAQNIS